MVSSPNNQHSNSDAFKVRKMEYIYTHMYIITIKESSFFDIFNSGVRLRELTYSFFTLVSFLGCA